MKKELQVQEKVDFQSIGGEISHELAAKMVKDYHDMNTFDGSHSYIIGKNMIQEVLDHPGCVGMRFFDAYNEAGEKTLVYVGIDAKGKSILEVTTVNSIGKIAVVKATVGDQLLAPKPFDWANF